MKLPLPSSAVYRCVLNRSLVHKSIAIRVASRLSPCTVSAICTPTWNKSTYGKRFVHLPNQRALFQTELFDYETDTGLPLTEQLEHDDVMGQEVTDNVDNDPHTRTMRSMSPVDTDGRVHNFGKESFQEEIVYDEDYDEYNLHMSPSSGKTSDHHESIEGMEILQHEDVFDVKHSQDNWGKVGSDPFHETWEEGCSDPFDQLEAYECDVDGCEDEAEWDMMYPDENYETPPTNENGPCD